MSDRIKIFFAIVLFIAAITVPLAGLVVGWSTWDVQTGLILMAATFFIFFILGGIVLFRVQDLSWLNVSLPYLLGLGYTLTPDLIPMGADDAAVTAAGSAMTFALALRKDPRTPKWILIPLLIGSGYIFLGGPIPGGLDELIINLLAVAVAGYGINRATRDDGESDRPDEFDDEIIEGEFESLE